jgi:hypothetical protein
VEEAGMSDAFRDAVEGFGEIAAQAFARLESPCVTRPAEEVGSMAGMGFELITLFGHVQYRRWLGSPRVAVRIYLGAMGGWVVRGMKFSTPEAAAAYALVDGS